MQSSRGPSLHGFILRLGIALTENEHCNLCFALLVFPKLLPLPGSLLPYKGLGAFLKPCVVVGWPCKQTVEPALKVWKELNSIFVNINSQHFEIVFIRCFLMRLFRSVDLSYNTVLASECGIICRKSLKEFKIINNPEDLQFKERKNMIKRTSMAFKPSQNQLSFFNH